MITYIPSEMYKVDGTATTTTTSEPKAQKPYGSEPNEPKAHELTRTRA